MVRQKFRVLVSLVVVLASAAEGQLFRPVNNQIDDKPQYTNPLQAAISANLFRNSRECQSNEGFGTCMTNAQCRRRQGRTVGSCTGLFQVCCKEVRTCDQEVTRNNTYFVEPANQNAMLMNLQCAVRVQKLPGICQLRLDLEHFSLRGPETLTGKCDRDSFVINGRDFNQVVPPICGENQGQHAYIEVGSVKGPVTLRVVTSEKPGDTGMYRRWSIRVAQIPCASIMKAPQGCLQYYTGLMPQNIRSWNYDNTRPAEETYPGGLDYTVCIRKEYGMCTAAFSSEGKFGLAGPEADPNKNDQCDKDYIWIGDKKYCGGGTLPKAPTTAGAVDETPRTKGTGPLMFHVVSSTDQRQNQEVRWPGFNVKYRQEICEVRRLL